MKKITKILIAGCSTLAGVTAVTKLIQSKTQKKKKEEPSVILGEFPNNKFPNIVIIGKAGTGKSRCYLKPNVAMECCRPTCHGTPTSEACRKEEKEKKKEKEDSSVKGIYEEAIRKHCEMEKIVAKNTKALQSLTEDEQTLVKGLMSFLRTTGLADELDDSVTLASIIEYMKDTGYLDKVMALCDKKGVAFDDTENIIRIVFKAGRFNKHMDAEQKLSIILDELSEDYFDREDDKDVDDFSGEDCD